MAEHSYAGWIALLLKRSNHVPFIIHSHNLEAIRFRHMQRWWWKGYYHYERWIHQKADCNFLSAMSIKRMPYGGSAVSGKMRYYNVWRCAQQTNTTSS
jgi:hypothetical protein